MCDDYLDDDYSDDGSFDEDDGSFDEDDIKNKI